MIGKYFVFKGNLINDQLIHNEEKSFECVQCDKRIIIKVIFVDHQRIHIGEEPF